MNALLRTPSGTTVGAAWLALVAATTLSWWLGSDHGVGNHTAAASLLIAVALGKVYVIGMAFMDLRRADPLLRRAFQAYTVIVAVALIGMLVVLQP